jgi:hypothetical protein
MLPCRSDDVKERSPFIEEAVCVKVMQLVPPDGSVRAGGKALLEIWRRLKRYRDAAALYNMGGSKTIARVLYRWLTNRR